MRSNRIPRILLLLEILSLNATIAKQRLPEQVQVRELLVKFCFMQYYLVRVAFFYNPVTKDTFGVFFVIILSFF